MWKEMKCSSAGAGHRGNGWCNREKRSNIPDAYADSRFDRSFDAVLGYHTGLYWHADRESYGLVGVLELLNVHAVSHWRRGLPGGRVGARGTGARKCQSHLEIARSAKTSRNWFSLARFSRTSSERSSQLWRGPNCGIQRDLRGCWRRLHRILSDGKRAFLVAVGDVSGKGIGAALVMSSLHTTCRALVRHVHAIEHITKILTKRSSRRRCRYLRHHASHAGDPGARRVHYIRAGHNRSTEHFRNWNAIAFRRRRRASRRYLLEICSTSGDLRC